MPDDVFRIELDMSACDSGIAELRQHVERLGEYEAARRLGGKIDVSKFFTLEWENNMVSAIPTDAFRDALATLAKD